MSNTSENHDEIRINILKTASQNYDNNLLKYYDFFKTVKFYKYKIANSDIEKSKIYLYDENKNLIIDLDFDITILFFRNNYMKLSNRSHIFHNNARQIMIDLNEYSMKEWYKNKLIENKFENIRLIMDNDLLIYYNNNDVQYVTSIISHYIKRKIFLNIIFKFEQKHFSYVIFNNELSEFYEFSYFFINNELPKDNYKLQIVILNEDKLDDYIINNSQTNNSKINNSKTNNSKINNSKTNNSKIKDTETSNTETKDTETKDTETKDTETSNSETKDTETKDTETSNSEIKDTETFIELDNTIISDLNISSNTYDEDSIISEHIDIFET